MLLTAAVAAATAVAGLVAPAVPAAADGPTSFSNTAAISVPATGSADQIGPASPYPSPITVSGLTGPVTKVTLTLNGVTHASFGDIDAMLVSPSGQNLVFL
ncbi:MAG TPA: hypothetical protein VFN19_00960, partial [Candidatus Nanopelagicales bacterium]|nr:hypothetical protein [Candidatus Nanopelagicales bacterium]